MVAATKSETEPANTESPSRVVAASGVAAILLPFVSVIWLAGFLYLGLASRIPEIPWVTGRHETVALAGHFSFSFVMAILLYGSIRGRRLAWPVVPVLGAAFILATLVGGLIEGMQALTPEREPNLTDFMFDGFGALAGTVLVAPLDAVTRWRSGLVVGIGVIGVAATLVVAAWLLPELDRLL